MSTPNLMVAASRIEYAPAQQYIHWLESSARFPARELKAKNSYSVGWALATPDNAYLIFLYLNRQYGKFILRYTASSRADY